MAKKEIVQYIQSWSNKGYSIQSIRTQLLTHYSEKDVDDALHSINKPKDFDIQTMVLLILFIAIFIGGTSIVGLINGNLFGDKQKSDTEIMDDYAKLQMKLECLKIEDLNEQDKCFKKFE